MAKLVDLIYMKGGYIYSRAGITPPFLNSLLPNLSYKTLSILLLLSAEPIEYTAGHITFHK